MARPVVETRAGARSRVPLSYFGCRRIRVLSRGLQFPSIALILLATVGTGFGGAAAFERGAGHAAAQRGESSAYHASQPSLTRASQPRLSARLLEMSAEGTERERKPMSIETVEGFSSFFAAAGGESVSSEPADGETADAVLASAAAPDGAAIRVSDAAGLAAALAGAQGGETILLEPGNFGALDLTGRSFGPADGSAPVILRSADPEMPASFSTMMLRDVANLEIADVIFDYEAPPGAADWDLPFQIIDGLRVTIRDSVFDGDLAEGLDEIRDGHGTGRGLLVGTSREILIEDNEFFNFKRGATFGDSQDVVIRGNDIHSLRSDGINVTGGQRILIENNHFHDFDTAEGSGDHADMIQLWTRNTTGAVDVTIRGNVLNSGEGGWTQSIFMGNERYSEGDRGPDVAYRNIVIENNVIHNAHVHGITVGHVEGLRIANNTLLQNADSGGPGEVHTPAISVAESALDVVVVDNVAPGFRLNGAEGRGWTVAGNLAVQRNDPTGAAFVGDLFVNALTGGTAKLADLMALPGGEIELAGIGALLSRFDANPGTLTAIARVEEVPGDLSRMVFDAGYTANPNGLVGPDDALFVWDFGDGTTAEGQRVEHVYATPGQYDVMLSVIHEDGSTAAAAARADVEDPLLLDLSVVGGQVLAEPSGDEAIIASLEGAETVLSNIGPAIRLEDADSVGLHQSLIPQVFGLDAFTLSFSLQALDGARSAGDVLSIHTAMGISVRETGELRFWLNNAQETGFEIVTGGARLLDGAAHRVSVVFDGPGGVAMVYVDGKAVGTTAVEGRTQPMEHWGLVLGSNWNSEAFDGLVTGVEILGEAASPETIATLHAEPWGGASSGTPPSDPDGMPVTDPGLESDDEPSPFAPGTTVLAVDFEDPSEFTLTSGGKVAPGADGGALTLDGVDDGASMRAPSALDGPDALSMALDFRASEANLGSARLLWKHTEYGIGLRDGMLAIEVGIADGGTREVRVPGTDLDDGEWHRVGVTIDAEADILAVHVDGEEVHRTTDLDIEIRGSGREIALGEAFGHAFAGQIDNILISDQILEEQLLFTDLDLL